MAATKGRWSLSWVLMALLAGAFVLLSPMLHSSFATPSASAPTTAKGRTSSGVADSVELDELQIANVAQQVQDRLGIMLDKKLNSKFSILLKDMEASIDGRVVAKLDTELPQRLKAAAGEASAGSSAGAMPADFDINILDSKIDLRVEKRLDDKLDKKIDFRISKKLSQLGPPPAPQAAAGSASVMMDPPESGLAGGVAAPASAPRPEVPEYQSGKCNGHSVTGTSKEWCGLNDERKCLDKWENNYLREHAEDLRKGLATLRAPGCYPHGVSIATMGYFRTGSTLLFNTARLWAALGAGEALVGGWACKNPSALGIGMKGSPVEQCSMICKDHELKDGVAENVEVMLMSRRDPFYSVCSRKLMDVWCRMSEVPKQATGGVDWDQVHAYKKKCLETPEIEKEETARQCLVLMQQQADIYFGRRSKGNEISHDMLMEDWTQNPSKQVSEIALAMGICTEAATDPELVKFVVAMGVHLKSHPDQDMAITQMHDVHTPVQRRAKCSNLEQWMRTDAQCREWMDGNASSSANALLRKMMQGKEK